MKLPAQVELLRKRLPEGYAPAAPMYDTSVNTQHTLDVVVATLLALTDGKLAEMQDRADAEALARLNSAAEAAEALARRSPRSGSAT